MPGAIALSGGAGAGAAAWGEGKQSLDSLVSTALDTSTL